MPHQPLRRCHVSLQRDLQVQLNLQLQSSQLVLHRPVESLYSTYRLMIGLRCRFHQGLLCTKFSDFLRNCNNGMFWISPDLHIHQTKLLELLQSTLHRNFRDSLLLHDCSSTTPDRVHIHVQDSHSINERVIQLHQWQLINCLRVLLPIIALMVRIVSSTCFHTRRAP